MRDCMLDGIRKVAISAWYTKLMKMAPRARANLLNTWNPQEVAKHLGTGAANVSKSKANYKVLANKARQHAQRVMPKGQGYAGHGMEHVFDVVNGGHVASGARKFIGATPGKMIPKSVNPLTGYSRNAVVTTPLQRQTTIAALLHDTGKAGEKAMKANPASKAMFKANPFKYSHATTGAKNSTQFLHKNKALAQNALNGPGVQSMDGANRVSRAILGHNDATWVNRAGSAASKEQAGRLLRFADDGVGNMGGVGNIRTVGNKGVPASAQEYMDKGKEAVNWAKENNLTRYNQMLAEAPVNARPWIRAQAHQYWNGLDMAANKGLGAAPTTAAGKKLMRESWQNANKYGLSPVKPSQVMPSYFLN